MARIFFTALDTHHYNVLCFAHPPYGDMEVWQMEHVHENTQQVVNRLSRAIGHMEAVKKMVLEDRECSDVLIQLAAVKSAVNNIGKEILKHHIQHCIVHAIEHGDMQAVQDLQEAIDKFMK